MSISLETLALAKALAKKLVAQAIADASGIGGLTYSVVEQLPSTGTPGVVYLLPREDEDNQDLYEEYLWVNNRFERIPWKTVDLTDYAKVQSLSWEQYEALSTAEKNNGTFYAIYDQENIPNGDDISY